MLFVEFHQFQVTQATGQPIFNPPVPPQVMPYHPSQMQTVQSQSYPPAIRMYPTHDAQQQPHLTSYLVPTPPSTTPSPGQAHQQTFHPQASPATGPPTQAFQPPGQYVMLMPSNGPPFVYNQHNPQSFQIVPNPMSQQPQQHPQQ
jgi:ataxin 2/2L